MKVIIDTDIVKNSGLRMCDFYMLLATKEFSRLPFFPNDSYSFLKDNRFIISEKLTSASGLNLIDEILLKSSDCKERNLDELVEKLQDLWPAGSKDGKYRWKCNKKDVKKRLQKFFKIYGDKYTDDEILEAARRYVKPFDDTGDRKYQKILVYFIFKDGDSGSYLANNLEAIADNEVAEQHVADATLF